VAPDGRRHGEGDLVAQDQDLDILAALATGDQHDQVEDPLRARGAAMTGNGSAGGLVRYGQPAGRWVLLATVLGSGLAFIDATVVNIALPRIGLNFHADAAALQWTVNGYTLSLASLILLGGSLGDRFGRRRTFVIGVTWFAAASLLCGLAPNIETLIAARVLQGVGGALLTPGSLAILQAAFHPQDRAKAIGAWSGLGGIAGALGPFLGGWLVQAATWRLVFLINVPLAALVAVVAIRHVPESRNPDAARRLDFTGVLTGAAGLAGLTYGFTAWPALGPTSPTVLAALCIGLGGMLGFLLTERRSRHPMLPLEVFASKAFTAANLVTFAVYAALGGVFFLAVLNLQVVARFTPLAAGIAMLPITVLMLLLSARAGALAQRLGPRIPMTVGPVVCAGALLLFARVGANASYVRAVLPAVLILGLGLSLTVAPLTAVALGSVDERHAGVASGVNNAVARAAGLLAVAVLPLAAGLGAGSLTDPAALMPTYRTAMLLSAGLLLAGAVTAFVGIPSKLAGQDRPSRAATDTLPTSPVRVHCAIDGPPLQPQPTQPAAKE
jgi:EmrB/QacA subfamily drug resistance transporter